MRQRYERGVISLGDSLEAERQRLLAEANLRSAVAALTISYVAIQKALGLGWSEAAPATAADGGQPGAATGVEHQPLHDPS